MINLENDLKKPNGETFSYKYIQIPPVSLDIGPSARLKK